MGGFRWQLTHCPNPNPNTITASSSKTFIVLLVYNFQHKIDHSTHQLVCTSTQLHKVCIRYIHPCGNLLFLYTAMDPISSGGSLMPLAFFLFVSIRPCFIPAKNISSAFRVSSDRRGKCTLFKKRYASFGPSPSIFSGLVGIPLVGVTVKAVRKMKAKARYGFIMVSARSIGVRFSL